MIAPEESRERSPEVDGQIFNWMMDQLVPLGERHLSSKISAYTSGGKYDTLYSKYELPSLSVSDGGQEKLLRLTIFQDDMGSLSKTPIRVECTTRKLQVNWHSTEGSQDQANLSSGTDEYSAETMNGGSEKRLLEIVGLYGTAAQLLTADEAKALGFTDEAISYLSGNLPEPEI